MPPSTVTDIGDEACAIARESNKSDGDYHDKRDLCAQFRAATAAERAARETGTQTWIAAFGLIAVVVALIFNVRATDAAAESARRAAESNEQARIFFTRERRAWLSVSGDFRRDRDTTGALSDFAYFEIIVKNVGASPATNVWLHTPDYPADEAGEGPRFRALVGDAQSAKGRPHQLGISLLPGQEHRFERAIKYEREGPSGVLHKLIAGFVQYKIEGDDGVHVTPFTWLATAAVLSNGIKFQHHGKLAELIDPD